MEFELEAEKLVNEAGHMKTMDESKVPSLSDEQITDFLQSLGAADPIDALREIAMRYARNGLKQREIYLIFLAFHVKLEAEGKEDAAAILGDVMDMITDAYPPYNLGIPK